MHQPDQSLWINARLATCDAANPAPYGALEGHALWLKDGRIHAVPCCRKPRHCKRLPARAR